MENHSIAELTKEKGNIAFKAKDYATARSLYSHAMAFDRSNHYYPLNRTFANLKLARCACCCFWLPCRLIPHSDGTKPKLTPRKPSPDSRNLKALYRRGVARKELGKWDQARADVQMYIDNGGDPAIGAQEFRSVADAESLPPPQPSSHTSGDLESTLAQLHLEGDSSFFTIHTSAAVQSGEGAFASRDIQRGDLILSEKPIFSIRTDCPCFPNRPLVGIYSTNGFGLGADSSDSGISNLCFGHHSRGEEIFIAYISGFAGSRRLYGAPRQLRQTILRDSYHFTCACTVCSLTKAESKKSDARRVKVYELREKIQSPNPGPSPLRGIQVLNAIIKGVRLLKEEGYLADADDFTTHAGLFCALHSDWVSAKYWAGLTYHTRVAEFGEDSPQTVEARGEYLNPRSFPFAGRGPVKDLTAIRL
ncbi:hypothetical protein EI94DRAFT_1760921 [Lactarius quietus]|nr:hypothetical protein EI94DRAFT_1760921 [Lactarius quietus]